LDFSSWPDPSKQKPQSLQEMSAMGNPNRVSEEEEAEKEMKVERDDPTLLKEARDWDEFKDDHRRGWGNRMNRS
jgi:immunoglobulin-binding protein 1